MGDFERFVENLRNGNIEEIKNTFKEGFVNGIVEDKLKFPINIACKEGMLDIVKLLLEHNCNIECEDFEQNRPIHYAIGNEHVEIVKLLLLYNCNIECENFQKFRPIHFASIIGHVEIVKLLLQYNCDIECENFQKTRPIHGAVDKRHFEIVKLLLEHNCNIECENIEKLRPIHIATQYGHVEIIKLLLEHNCNIECENFQKFRPIHFASIKGHVEIVKLLLDHKCNIECEDKLLSRPIHAACQNGYVEIVKLLLQHNCNIECENKWKLRPIHVAIENGHVEIVKLLLDNKCIIECEDFEHFRPIHYAIEKRHFEIVKLLVERNCNIECKTKEGYSPMELAEKYQNKKIIDILIGRNSLSNQISDEQLKRQISMMGLICTSDCDHKLCPKSLHEKTFHIGPKIGSGAFGEVFRRKGSGIDREFAIKRIKLNQISAKSIEGNIEKFLSKLKHVRIVQYFGSIVKDKHLCIFMEFLSGGSLEDKIKNEKFIKTENIILYSKQILEGLEFLHKNKIIHRDLKPANILMYDGNNIKLVDFGISRLLIRTDGKSTNAHTKLIGTYNFMAPEVMNNESYNVYADIWSLGATIINMITGKPPYHDHKSVQLIYKISTITKFELPQSPAIPSEMKIFIEKMLNPDYKSRPTATELLKSNLFNQ